MNSTPNTPSVHRKTLTTKRYRPSLSLVSLKHILYLASFEQANIADVDKQANEVLIKVLTPFISKIEVGATQGAYDVSANHGIPLKNQLGLASDISNLKQHLNKPCNQNIHSRKLYWKECYDKYHAGAILTPVEQEAMEEHRYLEGMMTEEEEEAHESKDIPSEEIE